MRFTERVQRIIRLEGALLDIMDQTDGKCASFTTGIGSCFDNGRNRDATDGADMPCPQCVAYRALVWDVERRKAPAS